MKAHSNYTTTVTTAASLRRGTTALLALAALIFTLIGVLRSGEQVLVPNSASKAIARHASDPIASCRACRDEWAAARVAQLVVAVSTGSATLPTQSASILSASRANAPIAPCRTCRDEWLAARSALDGRRLPINFPRIGH